jgi:hypothetical protein
LPAKITVRGTQSALRVGQDGLVARHHLQHVEQLALVFVDALDLHVEQAGRVDHDAGVAAMEAARRCLLACLTARKRVQQQRVVGVRTQRTQLVEVEPPAAPMRAVDQRRQARVGLGQPAPRRHAVGHVGEALGPQRGEVGEDGLPSRSSAAPTRR